MDLPDWLSAALKSPTLIASFLTISSTILLRVIQPRPKVVWGTSHGFSFRIPRDQSLGGEFLLHTQTVFIQNIGWIPAENIEVIINFKPDNFSVWPQLNYTTTTNPEGRFILNIANLGRREYTTIEMLHSVNPMPNVLRTRTPRGECKQVPMAPVQVVPPWVRVIVAALMLFGMFSLFQWVASKILGVLANVGAATLG